MIYFTPCKVEGENVIGIKVKIKDLKIFHLEARTKNFFSYNESKLHAVELPKSDAYHVKFEDYFVNDGNVAVTKAKRDLNIKEYNMPPNQYTIYIPECTIKISHIDPKFFAYFKGKYINVPKKIYSTGKIKEKNTNIEKKYIFSGINEAEEILSLKYNSSDLSKK